jgi:WD40 repeat protein
MLWLSHGLEIAPDQDTDLQRDIRANLSIWHRRVHSLRAVLAHPDIVRTVAFRPHDGKVAVTSSFDNTARLWDTSTGKPLGITLPHADRVFAAAYSPDGKTIATGSRDGTVRLWDADTGRPLDRGPMRHQDAVWAVAFSPDGKTLVTGSRDRTARLWETATGKQLRRVGHDGDVFAVAFRPPDGATVVTAGGGAAPRLWDREGKGPPRDAPWGHSDFWVTALDFSPDGKTVLTGAALGTAQLWDADTCKPLGPPLQHQQSVWAVAFRPTDGKFFATGGGDGMARLWETATGKPVGAPLRHQDQVAGLAFGPDGRTLLTVCVDHTARLWDVNLDNPLGRPLPMTARFTRRSSAPTGSWS